MGGIVRHKPVDQEVDAVGVMSQRVFREVFQEVRIVLEGDLDGADSGFVPVRAMSVKWSA